MTDDAARFRRATRGARTLLVPPGAVGTVTAELGRALTAAQFTPTTAATAAGVVGLYRRGSAVGDVLLGGSGLSLLTSRIGPLSALGVVVVWAGAVDPARSRVIVSMVAGSHVGDDFVTAVDDAVAALRRQGIIAQDDGWSRAVDVPADLAANPKRAAELGLV